MHSRNWHWTLNRRLRRFGWDISRYPNPSYLTDFNNEILRNVAAAKNSKDFAKLLEGYVSILSHGGSVYSQLGQDAFVVGFLNSQVGLTYLELGAYDPFLLSNTATLRETFDWSGLSVDPNPEVTKRFKEHNLASSFREVGVAGSNKSGFLHREGALTRVTPVERSSDSSQELITLISILDLVQQVQSIDYLSLDIEGGELDVLSNFPFDKVKPLAITVEHNYRAEEALAITQLLTRNGYRAVLPELSDYESWFILLEQSTNV